MRTFEDIPIGERDDIVLTLVENATPILNRIHHRNYSKRYWLILLAKHFNYCIRIKKYLERKSVNEIEIIHFPILGRGKLRAEDYIIAYGRFFYSAILNIIKREGNELAIKNNADLILGDRSNILNKCIGGGVLESQFHLNIFYFRGDRNKRKILKDYIDKIDDKFVQSSLYSIPKVFIEFYNDIDCSIKLINPEQKKFHYEHYNEYYFDFLLGKYAENGSELHEYQGGGHVGEILGTPSKLVYRKCNYFHTFGWVNSPKDLPDKPFRLIEFKGKLDILSKSIIKATSKTILFVFPTVTAKTSEVCEEVTNYLNYGNLKNSYERIIVRPRPLSRRLALVFKQQKFNWKNFIEIDRGNNHIVKTVAKVSLVVVIGLPSTTFLECLYVGKPVIALNTNKNPSTLFSKFLPGLINSGIVFDNLEKLFEVLYSIDDIESWWGRVYSQNDVREFARIFAGVN